MAKSIIIVGAGMGGMAAGIYGQIGGMTGDIQWPVGGAGEFAKSHERRSSG